MVGTLRLRGARLNVLLTSGHLAATDRLHGESVLALDFRGKRLQAATASVVPDDDGEGVRLDFGGGVAVFAAGTAHDELPRGAGCCMLPLELLRMLPRDGVGRVLSKGSCAHAAGECVPCKFHCTERGCKDGVLCGLCHFPHAELTRAAKRAMVRGKALPENCLDYSCFVEPAFHRFIEALCKFMTTPEPQKQSPLDFPQIPIFLKNTFLHFSQDDRPQDDRPKRSSSVPRRLRASPKAAPAYQPEHEPMYIVSAHVPGATSGATKGPMKVPCLSNPGTEFHGSCDQCTISASCTSGERSW